MRSSALLLSALAIPLVVPLAGCGDACEDLQSVCDDCSDADYREACQHDVDAGVQRLCSNRAAFYRQHCPVPPPTTTTTTSGSFDSTGAGAAGGMSAGGASAGGMSAGGGGIGAGGA
jgi:uncharacterized membrane protein YgcG